MSDANATPQLKEWFDVARHRSIAHELSKLSPRFQADVFLDKTLVGLNERSLMQRVHQCAVAVEAALPGSYRQKVQVLRRLAPVLGHAFVAIFLCDFVASYGLEDFDFSMEALAYFTVFGSAEFAVRPFIVADQPRALQTMLKWAQHADENVRRLASEGSRPRLPWGLRLVALVRDPSPTLPILDLLKTDPSEYVRRSVANHLNDVTKDHPERVLKVLQKWDLSEANLERIARHACRTLIKRGHSGALHLFGVAEVAEAKACIEVTPQKLKLGERLTITATLNSTVQRQQKLAVDYVIHYAKAGGVTSEKVFKWTVLDLAPSGAAQLVKTQVIRDFTTRKHYPGVHKVELQVNGRRVAEASFLLS